MNPLAKLDQFLQLLGIDDLLFGEGRNNIALLQTSGGGRALGEHLAYDYAGVRRHAQMLGQLAVYFADVHAQIRPLDRRRF